MCGSRKYLSSSPRKILGNSDWRGGFKGRNFQGVGGEGGGGVVMGSNFSKG